MPVSSLTMWGPPDQFLRILYGAHSDQFLSLLAPPPQVTFFAYYMGAPSGQFLCLLYEGPLRSILLLTMWGLPQIRFFAYYMDGGGGGSGQFLRLL